MNEISKYVVVLGASNNPERYSYKAVKMLKEYGYTVKPVHPSGSPVDGTPTLKTLKEISLPIDTVTVYVNPKIAKEYISDIITLSPRRVIFNPGTEDKGLIETFEKHGIECIEACTLVMLKTGVF